MMYTVEWTPKAFRRLKKVRDQEALKAIKAAARALTGWPQCRNVKAMANHPSNYRIRAGTWRLLFDVRQDAGIIIIQEVKKRDERTY